MRKTVYLFGHSNVYVSRCTVQRMWSTVLLSTGLLFYYGKDRGSREKNGCKCRSFVSSSINMRHGKESLGKQIIGEYVTELRADN
jgi:hypothetical protein